MLSARLICVGKLKERYLMEACAEYQKRLGPLCRLDVIEVPEEPDRPGALEREGARVLAAIPGGSHVIALCIEGKLLGSEALSAHIEGITTAGLSRICLIIGGSQGLSESVKSQAALRLSMSPMTFPHHLARVMVLEQLYRALSILGGGKYHK